jgi:hypothetical protein
MVAVMVLLFKVCLLPPVELLSRAVCTDRMPYSVPEALPLLTRLPKLVSLGEGLSGASPSPTTLFNSDTLPLFVDSALSSAFDPTFRAGDRFRDGFVRALREIGSSDITLGLGMGIGATSTTSISETGVSHDDVGEMVVGRVSVDVSIYDMVPRSNYATLLARNVASRFRTVLTSMLLGKPLDGNSSSKLK